MSPIKTKESNILYLGPTDTISDLPAHVDAVGAASIWKLTTDERKAIADGANIRLVMQAHPMPPVSLQVVENSDEYAQEPSPCKICGEEIDSLKHYSAESGGHAYRSADRRTPTNLQ